MKWGEIWSVAGGGDNGQPRPAVILQDDLFDAIESVTICAFTSDPTPAPLFRLEVLPSLTNGLKGTSRLMVDKITTVHKAKIGARIGVLDEEDGVRLDRAVLVFLGLAASRRSRR